MADRREVATHWFADKGLAGAGIARLVQTLDRMGWRGHLSFEVISGDCQRLPLGTVAVGARHRAAERAIGENRPACRSLTRRRRSR